MDSLWNYFNLSRSIWLRKKEKHSFRARTTRFGFSLFLDILFPGLLLGFVGLIDYAYLVPAFEIVAFQHVVQFDPQHDVVVYNGQPLGKFSEIDEFFGIYKHLGRGSWGEWGVRLKDGRYFVLSSGPYDGDTKLLAIYMNQYLKSTPRSIPQM